MAILSKRTFLAGSGSLVALGALGIGGSLVACNRGFLSAALPLERLDVALADIPAPDRIGRATLARFSRAELEDLVLRKAGLIEAMEQECPETRRNRIWSQFRDDFADGDVALADRWVVSRSECLVAALRANA